MLCAALDIFHPIVIIKYAIRVWCRSLEPFRLTPTSVLGSGQASRAFSDLDLRAEVGPKLYVYELPERFRNWGEASGSRLSITSGQAMLSSGCIGGPDFIWPWVKNGCPKWNPGKWNHGLKPAVPCWLLLTHTHFGRGRSLLDGRLCLRWASSQRAWR